MFEKMEINGIVKMKNTSDMNCVEFFYTKSLKRTDIWIDEDVIKAIQNEKERRRALEACKTERTERTNKIQ